jgi:hypothetical protein
MISPRQVALQPPTKIISPLFRWKPKEMHEGALEIKICVCLIFFGVERQTVWIGVKCQLD